MFLLSLFTVWIFVWLFSKFNFLLIGSGTSGNYRIDFAASSVVKKANVLTLTKETTSDSSNMVTKLVAENKFDAVPYETAGEQIWQNSGYFSAM